MSARGIITGRRWSNGRPIVKVTIAVALAASAVMFTTSDPAPVARHAVHQVPPCVEEDSAGPCYWDASTRGNGIGTSFTVDADQVVHYAATR